MRSITTFAAMITILNAIEDISIMAIIPALALAASASLLYPGITNAGPRTDSQFSLKAAVLSYVKFLRAYFSASSRGLRLAKGALCPPLRALPRAKRSTTTSDSPKRQAMCRGLTQGSGPPSTSWITVFKLSINVAMPMATAAAFCPKAFPLAARAISLLFLFAFFSLTCFLAFAVSSFIQAMRASSSGSIAWPFCRSSCKSSRNFSRSLYGALPMYPHA
mmetsp:Transcript_7054/g.12022  ORF Transcript_7054/g.12022 Transcript_7054/m.12022 type:complete len:220 (-) Transcript_7054:2537-3196(-)